MKSYPFNLARRTCIALVAAFLFLGTHSLLPAQPAAPGDSQAAAASLPPGVQDVVKLTQAGLNEDIILAQIKSGGATYQLSSDQLIYLSNVGVSQNVIKALISGSTPAAAYQEPTPAVSQGSSGYATQPATPVPAVTFDYFHDQLAPYGSWVQTADYGWAWNPSVAAADAGWRPYSDQGQWAYTNSGWFWQSQYAWGDIAFHYGRWYQDTSYGWLWVPDYTWAPSWVCWRHAEEDGYCGWAPLPPGARFVVGQGLFYNGRLAVDVDFGLPWDAFIFVGADHFWDHDYRHFRLYGDRAAFIYGRSMIRNGYRMDHGRFMVDGIGRDRMARFTHRDVRAVNVRDMRAREERAHVETRRVEGVRNAGRSPERPGDYRKAQVRPSGGPSNQHQAAPQAKKPSAKPAPGKTPPKDDKKKQN
jgi:hypothetical protein